MASANATAKAEAVIKKAAGEAQAQTPRRSLAKRTGEGNGRMTKQNNEGTRLQE
jgi:hypothetical protein